MKVNAQAGGFCSKAVGDWAKMAQKGSGIKKSKKTSKSTRPKPLVKAYHYFKRGIEVEFQRKYPDRELTTEVYRKCQNTWKAMTEAEKTPFRELARTDLQALKEKAAEKKRLEMEVSKPKEPLSCLHFFCKQLEVPNWEHVAVSVKRGCFEDPTAEEVWHLWAKLGSSLRGTFVNMELEAKQKYEKEMEEYTKSQAAAAAAATAAVDATDWEQELDSEFKELELGQKSEEGLDSKLMELNLNQSDN